MPNDDSDALRAALVRIDALEKQLDELTDQLQRHWHTPTGDVAVDKYGTTLLRKPFRKVLRPA